MMLEKSSGGGRAGCWQRFEICLTTEILTYFVEVPAKFWSFERNP